jgi:hypothetical protein
VKRLCVHVTMTRGNRVAITDWVMTPDQRSGVG